MSKIAMLIGNNATSLGRDLPWKTCWAVYLALGRIHLQQNLNKVAENGKEKRMLVGKTAGVRPALILTPSLVTLAPLFV